MVNNSCLKMFLSMPHYTNSRDDDNKDICHPITKEFREKLYGGLLAAYEETKNKVNEQVQQNLQNAPQQSQGMQTVECNSNV